MLIDPPDDINELKLAWRRCHKLLGLILEQTHKVNISNKEKDINREEFYEVDPMHDAYLCWWFSDQAESIVKQGGGSREHFLIIDEKDWPELKDETDV